MYLHRAVCRTLSWRDVSRGRLIARRYTSTSTTTTPTVPLIQITNSLFYRHHPTNFHHNANQNPPLFTTPLTFAIPPHSKTCILSTHPTPKSHFLSILLGAHIPSPPLGRTYPYFTQHSLSTSSGIQLVSFGSTSPGGGLIGGSTADGDGGYISARYESLRSATDLTLHQWLLNGGQLNPGNEELAKTDRELLGEVVELLRLDEGGLLSQPIMTLSNGQSRRAKIARALLRRPKMALLDEPFMGLDPPSVRGLSAVLRGLAEGKVGKGGATPVVALRAQDKVPEWINQLVYLRGEEVLTTGEKTEVVKELKEKYKIEVHTEEKAEEFGGGLFGKVWGGVDEFGSRKFKIDESEKAAGETYASPSDSLPEPLVEMNSISITYGHPPATRPILTSFTWTIRRGERWGVFGPNGSGKTTLLSLLTSDHPQTYSQEISHFGKLRSAPGTSIFDIQARIGQSSPEIHAFFPRHLSVRRVVESAWADTPMTRPPAGKVNDKKVDRLFEWFKGDLPVERKFGDLSMGEQRLLLFMRAVVKNPDLVILDEAFSGIGEEMRVKCLEWLAREEGLSKDQALVVVSHVEEEVPKGVSNWVRLVGGGKKAEFGTV